MDFDLATRQLSCTSGNDDFGLFIDIEISAHYQNDTAVFPAFYIDVRALSAYLTSKAVITSDYGAVVPVKGEKRVDAATGAQLIRFTDASKLAD